MLSVLLLALSLSADAAAAALCCGLHSRAEDTGKTALAAGVWFGGFQAVMTGIGGLFGSLLSRELWQLGRPLAFGLLLWLGGRMVWESVSPAAPEAPACPGRRPGEMAVLALATSLDALAAGLSLTYLGQGLLVSALTVGGVTFLLSLLSGLLGRRVGQRWNRPAQGLGGLILLGLGVKILLS